MIEDFKTWFCELASSAIKRKDDIQIKTGKRPKWNNKVKNKEIKEVFTNKGLLVKGVKPRSSNDRKAREWLYDLIWREFDSDNQFIGVKLAMEIELSDMKASGLVYDYNKLLQSDAEYKVFVFQQKTAHDSEELFDKLELCTSKYKNRVDSRYLLSCWCWENSSFLFKELVVNS